MKKRKWKNFCCRYFTFDLDTFLEDVFTTFLWPAPEKKVRMRVVYLSVGWTYWHAKYSLLEQEWTSASWLLAWPLSYVFTEKIQGEKYSGITVISNITFKDPRLYSQPFEGMPDPWTYNTWNNDIWLTDRLCNNIAVARDRPNW